jgi:AP2 domain
LIIDGAPTKAVTFSTPVIKNAGELHRFLTEYKFTEVDHVDGDSLNNRRSNLRDAMDNQGRNRNPHNAGIRRDNTTGFKGVTFHKPLGKFRAQIQFEGQRQHLGYFDTAEEAHAAYCTAANEHFGAFARCE